MIMLNPFHLFGFSDKRDLLTDSLGYPLLEDSQLKEIIRIAKWQLKKSAQGRIDEYYDQVYAARAILDPTHSDHTFVSREHCSNFTSAGDCSDIADLEDTRWVEICP